MNTKKLLLWVLLIIIGVFLAYVWYGFLFPDLHYLSRFGLVAKIKYLWIPRLLIPLFYFAIILVITLRNKQLSQNIFLLHITLITLIIVAYPILDTRYFIKALSKNKAITEQYHPYLQLIPPHDARLDHPIGKHTVKIFCLGGSTTEFKDSKGIGWPDRLEKELRKIYNTDSILVFNFGRRWYTTLHSLINYEANLRQYKPDVIILMHNINDLLQNADFSYFSNGPFRNDYGHFYGPSVNIFERSGLFGSFWTQLKPMWYHRGRTTFDQDTFPGLLPYTRNINTLIDLAAMDSTKIILMTQPNIYTENMEEKVKRSCNMVNYEAVGKDKEWGYHTAYVGMKQYNERIKAIAENRHVYFIDLEKQIPKSLTYFFDEVHYNDTTYSIVSKTLTEEMVKLKILPKLLPSCRSYLNLL